MTEKKQDQTNDEFARSNGHFRQACENAKVEPNRRQAGKFRRGKGIVYRTLKGLHTR